MVFRAVFQGSQLRRRHQHGLHFQPGLQAQLVQGAGEAVAADAVVRLGGADDQERIARDTRRARLMEEGI